MACVDNVCGTGGWAGPLPGDPDNNSILSAVSAYGGIDVSWSYPNTNPYAVSHTRLYRGITNNFSFAVLQKIVSGNFYYDKIPKDEIREYFYWIELVSINGTVGVPIGPASATPMSSIAETMIDLTGLIDEGLLAESLRSELGNIPLLRNDLDSEVVQRVNSNTAMSEALAAVQSDLGEALTYVENEITQRIAADEAFVYSVNTVAAGMGDHFAGVVNEVLARVDPDSALAIEVNTVRASAGGDAAAAQVVLGAVTGELGSLYTAKVTANGLVGGFGVYNDGSEVQAGFDVDTFWVGRTSGDKVKPFIVSGGTTYIADAAIEKLTFSKLRDAGGAFIVSGGKVKADYIDAINLNLQGQVNVGAYTGYAWPVAGQYGAHLSASGLLIGNANNGTYFQVTAAGNIYAPGFSVVGGVLTVSQVNVIGTSNIANNAVTISTSGSWNSSGSSTLLDLYIDTHGETPSSVVVMFQFSSPGWSLSIERNGFPIYSGSDGTSTLIIRDLPGIGNHQYRFKKGGGTSVGTAVILATLK